MEIDLKNLTSVLLFLLPGYFFLQGRQRSIAARDLTTLQETAQFFISSLVVHLVLTRLLSIFIDLSDYLNLLKTASLPEVLRDHVWILTAYVIVSITLAHYAGRLYGFIFLWIMDRGLGGWGPIILRPTLRNENLLLSIMRQRHIVRNKRKPFVFVRVRLKDGSQYEGLVRKYTFEGDREYTLYVRSATRIAGGNSVCLYWEEPPFDGVVIRSDAIASMEVSYRD